MIDSSPMYGSSQEVIGYGLSKLTAATSSRVFSADKVWISPGARGPSQIEASRQHWNVRADLLQVHNLLSAGTSADASGDEGCRPRALCRYHDV